MVAFIPSLPEMEAFLYKNNNFYVFQTDIVPTYGLTFSQIGIRLCPVQEEGVHIRIPCRKALEYTEYNSARDG